MRNWLPVLTLLPLLAGCAGNLAEDGETDDLSASTYSMEMVRANPSLAPEVVVPDGRRVNGHPRPQPEFLSPSFGGQHDESNWLYTANQLGQFLQLADPAIYPTDKKDSTYARKPGDLYPDSGKLVWDDVEQGYLGDCYFAASLVSVVFADHGGATTKGLIVPHVTGGKTVSYYVNFYQANGRKVRIEVDPDLPHGNTSGDVYYMTSTQSKPGYEEWSPSLIEKAYATWHKSYKAIGDGGTAADAIYALWGKKTTSMKATSAGAVAAIEAAGKGGRPQVACTYGDHDGVDYKNTGIYSDHCYTLRGIHRSGRDVFVQLRNPWGPTAAGASEPSEPPTDGVQDGIFEIPQAQFEKLYASVDVVP